MTGLVMMMEIDRCLEIDNRAARTADRPGGAAVRGKGNPGAALQGGDGGRERCGTALGVGLHARANNRFN
jgi:hypothetical protein